jgi:hypothetical protein
MITVNSIDLKGSVTVLKSEDENGHSLTLAQTAFNKSQQKSASDINSGINDLINFGKYFIIDEKDTIAKGIFSLNSIKKKKVEKKDVFVFGGTYAPHKYAHYYPYAWQVPNVEDAQAKVLSFPDNEYYRIELDTALACEALLSSFEIEVSIVNTDVQKRKPQTLDIGSIFDNRKSNEDKFVDYIENLEKQAQEHEEQ